MCCESVACNLASVWRNGISLARLSNWPVAEHPDDPALSAKVKMKPVGRGFEDLLAAVVKASGARRN